MYFVQTHFSRIYFKPLFSVTSWRCSIGSPLWKGVHLTRIELSGTTIASYTWATASLLHSATSQSLLHTLVLVSQFLQYAVGGGEEEEEEELLVRTLNSILFNFMRPIFLLNTCKKFFLEAELWFRGVEPSESSCWIDPTIYRIEKKWASELRIVLNYASGAGWSKPPTSHSTVWDGRKRKKSEKSLHGLDRTLWAMPATDRRSDRQTDMKLCYSSGLKCWPLDASSFPLLQLLTCLSAFGTEFLD